MLDVVDTKTLHCRHRLKIVLRVFCSKIFRSGVTFPTADVVGGTIQTSRSWEWPSLKQQRRACGRDTKRQR